MATSKSSLPQEKNFPPLIVLLSLLLCAAGAVISASCSGFPMADKPEKVRKICFLKNWNDYRVSAAKIILQSSLHRHTSTDHNRLQILTQGLTYMYLMVVYRHGKINTAIPSE